MIRRKGKNQEDTERDRQKLELREKKTGKSTKSTKGHRKVINSSPKDHRKVTEWSQKGH